MNSIRTIDLFSGAGGSSWGAREAGVDVVAGFDKWELAGKVYKENFPEAYFFNDELETVRTREVKKQIGNIDLIIASPECTNHSPAKGNSPRCELSKDTAFQVTRFAYAFRPRWIIIENVVSMRNWSRYPEFLLKLKKLGYNISEQVLNSKNFGVPQSRRRLFIICDKAKQPSGIAPVLPVYKSAEEVVDWSANYIFSPLRTPKRAKATIARADRAIQEIGSNQSFLLVYYSSDKAGGWQKLNAPLRTITTLDRFALVKPSKNGHCMRMLQPNELKEAMGMPNHFNLNYGTRRNQIRLIGNAVCPPVMKFLVRRLTEGS